MNDRVGDTHRAAPGPRVALRNVQNAAGTGDSQPYLEVNEPPPNAKGDYDRMPNTDRMMAAKVNAIGSF